MHQLLLTKKTITTKIDDVIWSVCGYVKGRNGVYDRGNLLLSLIFRTSLKLNKVVSFLTFLLLFTNSSVQNVFEIIMLYYSYMNCLNQNEKCRQTTSKSAQVIYLVNILFLSFLMMDALFKCIRYLKVMIKMILMRRLLHFNFLNCYVGK